MVAVFKTDPARSLLGAPNETLDAAIDRLTEALTKADSSYMWALYGVPGGVALMTRLEQIQPDGHPLPFPDRWRHVRGPPTGVVDYFIRLFTAPPGYYRTVVFIFTDQQAFVPDGDKPLPLLGDGGAILPSTLKGLRLSGLNAYALVYAIEKKDGDPPSSYSLISARNHLIDMGVISALETQRP